MSRNTLQIQGDMVTMSYMRCLWNLAVISFAMAGMCFYMCAAEPAQEGEASWYSKESISAEGSSGIMANGEVFNDEEKICASWFYDFDRRLRVTNMVNKRSVVVYVKDRGPSRRLVRQGRIIDLSKGAFEELEDLSEGLIRVRIEPL